MFTGLIETTGQVVEVSPRAGATGLVIGCELPRDRSGPGASVAVDGVCLTVTTRSRDRLDFDAVRETLDRTTLGRLRPGDRVNLERSLVVGDPLGGHLVQGHVDGVAQVLEWVRRGEDCRLSARVPEALVRYVAVKGSVALGGVSLTVAAVRGSVLEVALIPETLRRTTLGDLGPGDGVNMEVDLVARYLESLLAARQGG